MLGKLLKHDFKGTAKVMLPLHLILVAVTALGCLLLGARVLQRAEFLPLTTLLFIAYVLMIITLSTVTTIYLIVYFYRNLFTAQGYLTFTLPASPWSLLHSKLITGFVWSMVNTVLSCLSAFLLFGAASRFQFSKADVTELFQTTVVNANGKTIVISSSPWDIFGYSPSELLALLVLLVLVSCFYSIATGYGSVAIGQLYARHKVVGTVLALLANYLVAQLLIGGSIVAIAFKAVIGIASDSGTMFAAEDMISVMASIYRPLFPMLILIYLVLGIAGYVAAGIIMRKRVNLD